MMHTGVPVSRVRGWRAPRSLLIRLCRWALHVPLLLVLLLSPFSSAQAAPGSGDPGENASRSGWLMVTWGDGAPGSGSTSLVVSLVDEGGETTVLEIELRSLGQALGLNRRRVVASGNWADAPGLAKQVLRVSSLQLDETSGALSAPAEASAAALSGSQPWVNVLCKFSDVSSEPKALSYFDGQLGEAAPGLGHYWREVSYDNINIVGSGSTGWYTLPQTRAYYLGLGTSGMLNQLFSDCTAAADSSIHFPDYVGINLMFNGDLDGSAWGGSQWATLDGRTGYWYSTWMPPWGYNSQTVLAHEMGHGFGLPHSSGDYGSTYDNQWDVMSNSFNNCSRSTDPTYGCLGQHTISYHKDILGWFPPAQRFTATSGSTTITLEQLALPETGNYRMARIPIGGSSTHFYTVEARRWAGYDIKLPGEAVIIHDVDTARLNPAHVVDADGNGNTGDAGAMWTVGESFNDGGNIITVSVDSATASGFVVTISLGVVPPPPGTPLPSATSTAISTRTPTATESSTPLPTAAATSTSTATFTPLPTATSTSMSLPPTATPTATPTQTPTNTSVPPTATSTHTPVPPTATPTYTLTYTSLPPTATHTYTPTSTPLPPTATPSNTPLPPTSTPSNTPLPPTVTPTNTPANTLVPPTTTPTYTPTYTPLPPTATPTHTPTVTLVPPTVTSTYKPPPSTATPTVPPTNTPTNTSIPPTATPTYTSTNTPLPPTDTPVPATATPLPTDTPAPPTHTPSPPAATLTVTPVPPTVTPVPPTTTTLPTNTPVPASSTPVPPMATQTATAIPPTATDTVVPSDTPEPTASATTTSTRTPTATASATPSLTATPVPPTATPTSESEPEDINRDDQVNVLDVQQCVNVFLGSQTDPGIVARADVNGDGAVNVLDVQAIINAYLQG